jgi:hypothetical protein
MQTNRITFDAVRTACWRDNCRQYRAYLLDGELLFLNVGKAAGDQPSISHSAGIEGVIASLVFSGLWWWRREAISVSEQSFKGATDDDLRALADEKGSFRVAVADLQEVTIRSRSFWVSAFCCPPPHAGLLRFVHPDRGRMTFALPTGHDMLTAFESLRPLLGERLAVNIV